jgi:hypothetical protein
MAPSTQTFPVAALHPPSHYTRLLKVDLASGATQEYIYQLDNGADNGLNDVLAINDHEFLAIERDGRAGTAAVTRKIYRFDITGASDVSSRGTIASNGLSFTNPANKGFDLRPVYYSGSF